MDDYTTLRAEIKQWERDFRAQEGREPGINDIKARPDIAQKYKQYKKLSKAASGNAEAGSSKARDSQVPATPPRNAKRPSAAAIPISAKRAVGSTGPLSTFNPFSPQKAKAKDAFPVASRPPRPLGNPFASPAKSKKKERNSSSSRSASPPAPNTAVSRARKRLRGDQVSPSPNKEKRRKTTPDLRPLPKLTFNLSQSDDDQDDSDTLVEHTSFVNNSPVKGASSFALFDDTPMPSADIFGLNKKAPSQDSKGDLLGRPMKPLKSSKGKGIFPKVTGKQQTLTQFLGGAQKPALPFDVPRNTNAESSMASSSAGTTPPPLDDHSVTSENARSKSPLLPPSPPATATTTTYKNKGKRKADPKSLDGRKRAKMAQNDQSDDDASTSDPEFATTVKIIKPARAAEGTGDTDSDTDPVFSYLRPGSKPRASTTSPPPAPQHGHPSTTVIDLPDKLRNLLALDEAEVKATDREAEKVFQNLVYGRRVTHYDPKKGEIWDVGEEDGEDGEEGNPAEDDEWEGEPVPWEVGELDQARYD
ncbi:DNA replication and checkpoint protein-domain-containing protein [Coprinopsis sp. MPI-PUGE-AT-0042]|nr:DNA replication and checkpoint protein-domain-containing protein [Coprinopsis sp. MPI-PUGE-AT-0042]